MNKTCSACFTPHKNGIAVLARFFGFAAVHAWSGAVGAALQNEPWAKLALAAPPMRSVKFPIRSGCVLGGSLRRDVSMVYPVAETAKVYAAIPVGHSRGKSVLMF